MPAPPGGLHASPPQLPLLLAHVALPASPHLVSGRPLPSGSRAHAQTLRPAARLCDPPRRLPTSFHALPSGSLFSAGCSIFLLVDFSFLIFAFSPFCPSLPFVCFVLVLKFCYLPLTLTPISQVFSCLPSLASHSCLPLCVAVSYFQF